MFLIQIFQYICQIPPRVCTLVLFISTEVKLIVFVLEHNLPLDVADHAGSLFRSMFADGATRKTIQNNKHLTALDLLLISLFIYT